MATTFISYAREDRERVARFAAELERAGLAVWWDRMIEPGSEYVPDTETELARAVAVIVVWTKHSIVSHWVRDEAGYGREKGILVPILLDPVEPPLGFRQFQTIDLSKWHGGPSPDIDDIVAKIRRRAGEEVVPRQNPAQTWTGRLAALFMRPRGYAVLGAALVAVGVAAAMFLVEAERRKLVAAPVSGDQTTAAADPASIAVLPFADLSPAGDQQYFSDGVAEEILNVLAAYPGLRVAGRTSSFKFRNVEEDIREIGAALGVAHVLEGSVRRQGDRVRVTAQLIKVADGFHLWSETFDRDVNDIFAVQDEISRAVARALSLRIASAPQSKTADIAAYDLYLKGREELAKRGVEALNKAAALFKSASDIDPEFSSALSGRARALSLLWDYGFTRMSEETLAEAKGAVAAALKSDPANAEAYSVLGYINTIVEWDWDEAGRNFARAIELAPNDAEIANFAGDHFMYVGDVENSFANEQRAVALDPLHAVNYQDLAWRYMAIGRCDEALAQSSKATEVDPEFGVDFLRARVALCGKRYGEAHAAADRMARAGFRQPARDVEFALAIAERRLPDARRIAAESAKEAEAAAAGYHFAAEHAAALGDAATAGAFLEKAYAQRDPRFIIDYTHMLPEDWPNHPAIRAALDKPELNALYELRRRNLARWRASERSG